MRFVSKLAVVLVLSLCAAFYIWYRQTQRPNLAKSVIPLKGQQPQAGQPRPVYPHSVVPGGVTSGDEMKKAMASDQVVAKHYEGLDPKQMKAGKLTKDTAAYVSYRVKDKTYWTKRKVQLHKGEIVLGDGKNWVRARCGNRLAFVAQRPFLPPADEPSETDFDTPLPEIPLEVADLRLIPDLSGPLPSYRSSETMAQRTPEKPEKKVKRLTRHWPFGMTALAARPFPPGTGTPLLPPAGQSDLPEPSSIILVSAGLLGLAGYKFLKRAR